MRSSIHHYLLVVMLIMLTGCVPHLGSSLEERGAATLEEAVYQSVTCQPVRDEPGAFEIRDQRARRTGILVLYSAHCSEQGRVIPMVGYAFVEPRRTGWVVISSSYSGILTPLSNEDPAMTGNGHIEGLAIKYGQLLNPKIATVVLVLEDGRIQQATPRNSMFVLELPGDVRGCEIRFLDTQGHLIDQHQLQILEPCS